MELRSYGCCLPCLAPELLCVLDLIEPKILKVHLLFDRVGSVFFLLLFVVKKKKIVEKAKKRLECDRMQVSCQNSQ